MYALLFLLTSAVSAEPLPDGALLFLEDCNKFVELYTREEVGHVAMVFSDGTTNWVYEATPDKVRRVTVASYYDELARDNLKKKKKVSVLAYRPKEPYSVAEVETMRGFLDGQLGRRYSLLNYVTRRVGDGTHCAELTGNTLNHVERYKFEDPNRLSPGALRTRIAATHQPAERVQLPDYEMKESWCQRTSRRCGEWYKWCTWGCSEAWALCW